MVNIHQLEPIEETIEDETQAGMDMAAMMKFPSTPPVAKKNSKKNKKVSKKKLAGNGYTR